jgi:trans-AT polyketide synthase/acyltransferase/oxidoreductase domain-containing protein
MTFGRIDLVKIQNQIDEWNRAHPIGTKVLVKGYDEPKTTRVEALILFNQKAVIYLEGHNGYFDLRDESPLEGADKKPAFISETSQDTPVLEGTCFMFPGQGSQAKGMGEDLFDAYPELTNTASDVLDYSIKDLCLKNQEGLLDRTDYTQPALFVVSALSWLRERERSGVPAYLVGHSLGEYNALFAAEVFDFETGLKLVQKRGSLMASAQGGGMAAVIGMSKDEVEGVLEKERLKSLDVGNINSPDQVVLSGPKSDIQAAKSVFESSGADLYIPLKVSGAFHSRLMRECQLEFKSFISDFSFHAPKTPVISNLEALPYSVDRVADLLVGQISGSVNWFDSIRYLIQQGVTTFREIGPGKVLTGLISKIQKAAT